MARLAKFWQKARSLYLLGRYRRTFTKIGEQESGRGLCQTKKAGKRMGESTTNTELVLFDVWIGSYVEVSILESIL